MKVIIGLGNPGKKFENTRHNIGFLFLDFLAKEYGVSFREEKKFHSEIAEILTENGKMLLVKPTTFMNLSGTAIRSILHFYKLSPEDIVVVHDDVDIKSGTFKTTLSSRSAGNNGVQNIIDALGTQDFFRVRFGIGTPVETLEICMPTHDYVLLPFGEEERKKFEPLFPEVKMLLKI